MMRIGLSDPGLWNTLDRRECSFMALRMVCPDADVRDGGSVVAGKFTSKQVSSLVRWRAIDDGCDAVYFEAGGIYGGLGSVFMGVIGGKPSSRSIFRAQRDGGYVGKPSFPSRL
jgi:hypothetical protein